MEDYDETDEEEDDDDLEDEVSQEPDLFCALNMSL